MGRRITEARPNGHRLRVFIIDDQQLYRQAVRQALEEEIEVVGESAVSSAVVTQLKDLSPTIVMVGVESPRGFVVAQQIRVRCPDVAVVMMSSNPDDDQFLRASREGAVALLGKDIMADRLIAELRRVGNGEYPISEGLVTRPRAARKVIEQIRGRLGINREVRQVTRALSPRETEILRYVAEGFSNKRIGYVLSLSEQTIKNYVTSIMRKLGANDRAHAVVLAFRRGLIDIQEAGAVYRSAPGGLPALRETGKQYPWLANTRPVTVPGGNHGDNHDRNETTSSS